MIDCPSFYAEYHGHPVGQLQTAVEHFASQPRPIVFLAGDSSMDNKHWFFDSARLKEDQLTEPGFTAPACNGYEAVLSHPGRMVQDISYWVNRLSANHTAVKGGEGVVCVNCAVEESTVADRDKGLLPHDVIIRDHIRSQDYLVISLGGNDIALRPSTATIVWMITMLYSPMGMIRSGWAPGMGHFVDLYHKGVYSVVKRITEKAKPAKVIINMIYYLDEKPGGSWADWTLEKLSYDTNPKRLQTAIKKIYELVQEKGFGDTNVEIRPLFEVLDPKDRGDYCQRVEPSVQGGKKIATAFLKWLGITEPLPPPTAMIETEKVDTGCKSLKKGKSSN